MNRRFMKLAALTLSGGLVFQLSGCGGIIIQLLLRNVLTAVIDNALAGTEGTTP